MSRTGWLLTTTPISTQPLIQVNISNPTDGQALIYDAANTRWINGTAGVGSGSGTVTSSETVITFGGAGSVTLTAASILGRNVVVDKPSGGFIFANVSLPAASTLISTLNLTTNDMSWDFSIILRDWTSGGGGGGIVSFSGSGITQVGNPTVNANGSCALRVRRTSATTASVYVLSNSG